MAGANVRGGIWIPASLRRSLKCAYPKRPYSRRTRCAVGGTLQPRHSPDGSFCGQTAASEVPPIFEDYAANN